MDLNIDRESKTPLYIQIRNQIAGQIGNGLLAPGFRLPAERKLAQSLGVNRSTIIKAYEELAADGLVESWVGRGTRVRADLPPVEMVKSSTSTFSWQHLFNRHSSRLHDSALGQILGMVGKTDVISFASGIPDPNFFPVDTIVRYSSLILAEQWKDALDHSDSIGIPPLRRQISLMLADMGVQAHMDQIMVCSGSQQALDILSRILIEPGDSVVLEDPTYIGALSSFRLARARIVPIAVDHEGLRTDELEQVVSRQPVKLIYTMPGAHNPAACTMSLDRRRHLLDIAARYNIPVIEDDAYGILNYSESPLPTLYSMDQQRLVIYLGSSSKLFVPGLRVGWMAADPRLIWEAVLIKQVTDLHTATYNQLLVCAMLQDGFWKEHANQIRPQYKARRDAMQEALVRYAPPGLDWTLPQSGVYFWLKLPEGLNATRLLARTEARGVVFMPGAPFFANGGGDEFIRLSYSRPGPQDISEGIRIICEEIRDENEDLNSRSLDLTSISNLHLA